MCEPFIFIVRASWHHVKAMVGAVMEIDGHTRVDNFYLIFFHIFIGWIMVRILILFHMFTLF